MPPSDRQLQPDLVAAPRWRPSVFIGEALEQLFEPVLDTGLDASSKQQRLRDLLDGLLDVVGGVAITTGEQKDRGRAPAFHLASRRAGRSRS